MCQLSVRLLKAKDSASVYAIEIEAFAQPWSEGATLKAMSNADSYFYGILLEEKVIGYINILKILDEGHIMNLAVEKSYRGKGIAYQLLLEAMALTQKEGMNRYTLEVRKSNQKAINLYTKLGFKVEGIRKNYYRQPKEDGLVMWKNN